jgi:hypothetical protein
MKRVPLATALTTAAVAALCAVAPSTAHASTISVDAALGRLAATGTLSAADRATLLQHPDVAAHVVDPDPAATDSGVTTGRATVTLATGTRCGAWRDQWIRKRTLLGSTAYKFHQYMEWCYNGRSVTSIQQRYPYMSDNDGFFYFDKLVANSYNRPPAGEVNSYMQAKVDNCIPLKACISTTYPWVRIRAGNNGSSIGTSGV